jgi:hypothetical protein
MQIVKIQALAREGFAWRPRAGRFFPSGQVVSMEIVDGDVDPTVEEDKVDGAGKPYKALKPHPTRMSRKVFDEKIMTDPVLRVLSDGETISELSQAALDAARKHSADLASDLTDAKAKLAAAEELVAKLKAELATLKGKGGEAAGDPPDPKGKAADDLHPHLRKDEVEDTTLPDSPSAKARKAK